MGGIIKKRGVGGLISAQDLTCITLAGGKSRRLGRAKVFETIGDKSLLERVVSCLELFGSDIIVVTARNQSLPQFIGDAKLRTVSDIYPGKGPLGGIYTGLSASNSFYNLIVAGDMPFLNRALLTYMIDAAFGFDLVVPRFDGMFEPLHAIYSKNCFAPLKQLLTQGTLEIARLFNMVKVRYIESEEISQFDPERLSFFNINTEADLKRARELAKESIGHDKC